MAEVNEQENETNKTDKSGGNQNGKTVNAQDSVKDVKEAASGIAGKVYDAATEKATSVIDEQKASLAEGLTSIAENIRHIGDNMSDGEQAKGIIGATAQYSNMIADSIQQVSDYVEQRNLSEVMKDVENLAHRNPGLFLGGAFALGLLAARFIKSSPTPDSARSFRGSKRKNIKAGERDGVHLPENLDEIAGSAEKRAEKTVKSESNTGDNKSANAAASNKGV